MKKRFAIILTAAALSMTGCSLLGQDTYYIDQGMEQINSGNYEEALTSFSSAEQEGKHLVESYRGSGMAYMALGEYDKAVEAFDRAVDLTKEKQKDVRKDILMYKATALYQSGDYEGAAKVCDTIQTFGDSADAYYLQGLCYMELDEKDKAGVDFTTAVKLSPQDYDLLLNIYECYDDKNLSAEGDAYLQQALAINSDDSEDIYQKARIYYFLGDYDDAKTELNKMADSMDERSTMLLCRTYMKQDDTAHARQLYQQYMDKYGETPEAYNGMVLCDIADENYDSALENITKGLALSNDKGKQDLYFNEIVVYERKLDFATAKEKAAEYVKNYPADEAGQLFLQIIKLCRRKLVIADNAGRSQFLHQKGDLLDLSFSDIGARVDLFTILDHPSDHQCPGCLTKLCKFIQRFFHIFRKTLLNADQDHPLFQFFHVIWLHK